MNRKISVLIVTLLMCISTIVMIPSDFDVEATPGGGGGDNGSIGLDFQFIKNIHIASQRRNFCWSILENSRSLKT